jgi:hypothetical protein
MDVLPKRSMPLEPQAPKQTWSSSSRRATTAGGRSPATAFPPCFGCRRIGSEAPGGKGRPNYSFSIIPPIFFVIHASTLVGSMT